MVFRMPNSPPSLPQAISQVPLPSLQITKILREEPSVMVFEQIILKLTLRLNMRFCAVWKGNFVVRMVWYECQIWDQFRNWLKKKYSSQDENLRFTQIDVLQYFRACMCNSDMIHYHKWMAREIIPQVIFRIRLK